MYFDAEEVLERYEIFRRNAALIDESEKQTLLDRL